jgi:p-cumate 2,3-dioxygenase subunit beta
MKTISRAEIEEFLFEEADCLDRWDLDSWLALWQDSDRISYQVAPTNEEGVAELEPGSTMFLIADNQFRLQQRIVRMKKNSFHAEYHRSRTRHMYGHVRIVEQTDDQVAFTFNASVFRTKKDVTAIYPSLNRAVLAKTPDGLKLVRKRVELDLECLSKMGALTILL